MPRLQIGLTCPRVWGYYFGPDFIITLVMSTISLNVPETLKAELSAAASRRGISRSALIRQAIRAFLLADEKTKSIEPDLSQVADLVGAFSGPADLSVGKNYLDGFAESTRLSSF